jgi:UDP-N-acetylmuramoylalanine--D-glutamate ligase
MELRGKHVVVVGLAQTGVALARFCAGRGARVIVTDAKAADKLTAATAALADVPVSWQVGGHQLSTFTSADLVVVSPGVPDLVEMKAARAAGVEVIAEIELAFRCLHPAAQMIAITGTNGKSTTTALTGELCRHSGRPTFCGGNLGNMPLIDAVDHPANSAGGLIVAEVAAFMLEHCTSFRGRVGVLTNITEDHLDRFGTMERYAAMKGRIWDWQREDDIAIGNAADDWAMRETAGISSQLYTFDSRPDATVERGAFLSADRRHLMLRLATGEECYPTDDLVITTSKTQCAPIWPRAAWESRWTRSGAARRRIARYRIAWSWSATATMCTTTMTPRGPMWPRWPLRCAAFLARWC